MKLTPQAEAFLTELSKIALMEEKHVRPGAPITGSLEEMKAKLRPGDILITKPSAGAPFPDRLWHSVVSNYFKVRGKPFGGTHAALYLGDGKVLHQYDKKLTRFGRDVADTDQKVQTMDLSIFPKMNRDILAVRTKLPQDQLQHVLNRAKSMQGALPYNMGDYWRAAFMPAGPERDSLRDRPTSGVCTSIPGYSFGPYMHFHPEKSIKHIAPADIASHPDVDHVISFSKDIPQTKAAQVLGLWKEAEEFTPGIPQGKPVHPLPTIEEGNSKRWNLAVQHHPAIKSGDGGQPWEWGEYSHNHGEDVAPGMFSDLAHFNKVVGSAPISHFAPQDFLGMDNTDVPDLLTHRDPLREAHVRAQGYGRSSGPAIEKSFREGAPIHPALVMQDSGGKRYLLAGNTRSMIGSALGAHVPVKLLHYGKGFAQPDENGMFYGTYQSVKQADVDPREFAPGIPHGRPTHPLPIIEEGSSKRWNLAVQAHPALKSGDHHDIRLVDPETGHAHSWATKRNFPKPGDDPVELFQQPTHTSQYAMGFTGPIEKGYGATRPGTGVSHVIKSPIEVVRSKPDHLRFNLHGGAKEGSQEFVVSKTKSGKWWLLNVTKTQAKVPIQFEKGQYKEIPTHQVNTSDDNQIMTAKIDGACFPEGAFVETKELGRIKLSKLVNQKLEVHVKTWSPEEGICYRKVLHHFRRPVDQEMVTIVVAAGGKGLPSSTNCTRGHKFKTPNGDVQAADLEPGDTVFSEGLIPSGAQEQLLLGGLLGDSSIHTTKDGFVRVSCTHGLPQETYCRRKYWVLGDLCSSEPQVGVYKTGYVPGGKRIRLSTRTLPGLRRLSDVVGSPKKVSREWLDKLDERGLAIWFMDDGSGQVAANYCSFKENPENRQLSVSLHTEGYTKEENEIIRLWLQERWGVSARISHPPSSPYFWISMGAEAGLKFLDLVSPWVFPEFEAKMGFDYYKYPQVIKDKFSSRIGEWLEPASIDRIEVPVLDIFPHERRHWEHGLYNIEVADTHSYFVNGVLVGNSNYFVLRPGSRPRVYSYREPKNREAGILEHSHKFPDLYGTRVPSKVGDTIVRGEVYAKKDGKAIPAERVAGMLNSSTDKSLESQKELGGLRVALFDVVKFKGQPFHHKGYVEKLEALQHIQKHMPQFELPEAAHTKEEKEDLLKRIGSGKLDATREGVVLWHKTEPLAPIKAKFKSDHDVYVREIERATDKNGNPKNEMGAFKYSLTPDGPILGRIGTGFHSVQKRDMWARPDVYVGAAAKIKAERQHSSGAFAKGVFQEWHPDKSPHDFWSKSPVGRSGAIELKKESAWSDLHPSVRNAIIGAAVGTPLGAAYGSWDKDLLTTSDRPTRVGGAVRGAAVGGASGAGLGALTGLPWDPGNQRHVALQEFQGLGYGSILGSATGAVHLSGKYGDKEIPPEDLHRARVLLARHILGGGILGAATLGGLGAASTREHEQGVSSRHGIPYTEENRKNYQNGTYTRSGGSSPSAPKKKTGEEEAKILGFDPGKVKTKDEAKKFYRQASLKNHPDREGGSHEGMQRVNSAWKDFQDSEAWSKLATAFFDELRLIWSR